MSRIHVLRDYWGTRVSDVQYDAFFGDLESVLGGRHQSPRLRRLGPHRRALDSLTPRPMLIGFGSDEKVKRRLFVGSQVPDDTDLLVAGMLRLDVTADVGELSVSGPTNGEYTIVRWSQFQAHDLETRSRAAVSWASETISVLERLLIEDSTAIRARRTANHAARRESQPIDRDRPRRATPIPGSEGVAGAVVGELPVTLRTIMARLPSGTATRPILALRRMPARPAVLAPIPMDVHPSLALALHRNRGIDQLYLHQADAWTAVQRGEDIVVVTPTASGKTMCFNLPVIDRCMKYPAARAVYFYPTKALANDQLTALRELLDGMDDAPTIGVFHGDLARDEREQIVREPPNILLATPDILHFQQIPKHVEWRRWWANLQFVIIDEAHAYRGVFGSHIAHLVRRMRRVAALYQAAPVFIAASATIGNPVEHAAGLIGRSPRLIDRDGSPQAPRDIAIWEPLTFDGALRPVAYANSEHEAGRLFASSVLSGYSTIAFAKSRRTVERLSRRVNRQLKQAGQHALAASVVAYRSGFSRERRREIESGLRNGSVKGVIATNALELGIDIGSLDVAILSSYPGSTMSFRQQAGRAGRRDRPALVVMIASQNPLDRYIAAHPEMLLSASVEHAVTDLANPRIAVGQLGCAAREGRLTRADAELYGPGFPALMRSMVDERALIELPSGWEPGRRAARPKDVSLRSIDGKAYTLLLGETVLGEIDARMVAREAHPSAIYLHDGQAYRVIRVDSLTRTIRLESSDEGVVTEPKGERYIDMLALKRERAIFSGQVKLSLGQIKVSTRIVGYRELDEETGNQRGDVFDIEPMRSDLTTVGVRLEPFAGVDPAGLHAIEHLLRSLAPLTILCDRSDLDGHTEMDTAPVSAYVYDRHEGGVGLAERLFADIDQVLPAVAEQLETCSCEEGCPACIQSGSCLLENESLDKASARRLGLST